MTEREGSPRERAQGDRRTLPVPDGLDGLRLDAALARLFGFSRTTAASLVDAGEVTVDGRTRDRSDRVSAGSWLEVEMPAPAAPPSAAPEPVAGLSVVYADDDLVVVDKPVGVAAHPSPGWEGPTVVQGVAAMGHRISTSGAAERQGV
ncbi:MAG TPA: S4 domain-containing protein, partial [Mycobacteriales bacterium]